MDTVVIDYGAGNLRSLVNSLQEIGCEARLAETPAELAGAQRLILPGVGAFGDCVEQIGARGFREPVQDWFRAGKPFFGICVGYQVLFSSSEESPGVRGLELLPGTVRRFPSATAGEWKIPHMGWNQVRPLHPDQPLWRGFEAEPYFYFVHSYHPQLTDGSWAAATANYAGRPFATVAANADGSQVGTQFHPEKSQDNGLRLLRNWLEITG